MLCVSLKSYSRQCSPTSGGVSRIFIFDPEDFNFTQTTGDPLPGYSAIALNTGATQADGAQMYPVNFTYEEAEYKYTQSRKGCAVKYAHELDFSLTDLDQNLANFNTALDSAGCCCGIGVIIELNNGKVLVLGEKYVNAATIPQWRMTHDGSTGTSGKVYDDEIGQQSVLKGDYSRAAYEFTGGISAIEAFVGTGV